MVWKLTKYQKKHTLFYDWEEINIIKMEGHFHIRSLEWRPVKKFGLHLNMWVCGYKLSFPPLLILNKLT